MEAYEFKENLLRLFKIKTSKDMRRDLKDLMSTDLFKIEDEDEDTFLFVRLSKERKPAILIEMDKVLQIFNEIEEIKENKFTIHYNNNENKQVAEVAVSSDFYTQNIFYTEELPKKFEDSDNQIKYEIGGEVTDYYIVWLYKKMFEKYSFDAETEMTRQQLRFVGNRIIHRYGGTEISERGTEIVGGIVEFSILDIMRRAVNCHTLKVTKQRDNGINLDEAIESFSYTYMCNTNTPIKVYNIENIIGVGKTQRKERNNDFEAPKRKYNSDLLDYYNLAVSSDDPYISFISYYHIIEYYFDQVYREQQIKTLRDSITDPRFSNKDDDKVYKIIEKILKDGRAVREDGSGNELPSLIYLLNKYISDLDDYKERLNDEDLNFYQNNKVSFSQGDAIIWDKPKDKILKAISNRIYKTRNALIHSKSSKKDVTYHPYLHETELEKEICLIKTVAEHIIEADSELLV
ncbi:methylamine utilization protein MauJ [Priestia megaterium]|uniref:methylamine utilization protein MauJ n=1 Tax=Priestia megaterium TaxID=1404 RepID=UPI001FB46409|nr:methylamine utilization protein MauJ [Priestia megaterium]